MSSRTDIPAKRTVTCPCELLHLYGFEKREVGQYFNTTLRTVLSPNLLRIIHLEDYEFVYRYNVII